VKFNIFLSLTAVQNTIRVLFYRC